MKFDHITADFHGARIETKSAIADSNNYPMLEVFDTGQKVRRVKLELIWIRYTSQIYDFRLWMMRPLPSGSAITAIWQTGVSNGSMRTDTC